MNDIDGGDVEEREATAVDIESRGAIAVDGEATDTSSVDCEASTSTAICGSVHVLEHPIELNLAYRTRNYLRNHRLKRFQDSCWYAERIAVIAL